MEFIINHWFLFLMMFIASALSFLWLFLINKKLKMKWWEAVIISLLSFFFGIFGAITWNYVENGFQWSEVGTSVFGAVFFAPLVALISHLIFKRYSYLQMLDNIAIIVPVFMIFTRLNCIKSGCCYGTLIGDTIYRYPAREAEILLNVFFLVFAVGNILKSRFSGIHYFIYLLVYGLGRFAIEWFRESHTSMPLHFGHIWSLCALTISIIFLLIHHFILKKGNSSNEKA